MFLFFFEMVKIIKAPAGFELVTYKFVVTTDSIRCYILSGQKTFVKYDTLFY